MKFKVGDKVRRISGNHGGMHPGDTDVVLSVHDGANLVLQRYGMGHSSNSFKLVSGTDRFETYSFGVATDLMIDFDEIEGYLTYAKPLALVELNGKHWAVISRKINYKVHHCKGSGELHGRLRKFWGTGDEKWELHAFPIELKQLPKLIALLKEIKAAEFKVKDRNSGTVTVTLPNI